MAGAIALVRTLFGWLPESVTAVAVVSGPLLVLGYLVGSVPYRELLARRRMRRDLDGPATAALRPPPPASDDPLDAPDVLAAGACAALATLLATTVAWDVTLSAAPRGNLFSAVGIFSDQALGAWVSVALWTGAAVVVGHLAPVWTSFRGGSGVPPALALLAAYAPLLFSVAAAAFLVAYAATNRLRGSFLLALPVVVAAEYVAWIGDLQAGWGVTNGPELSLWTTVVAGALFARNLRPS